MRWWCSQIYEPWSWTPRPYVGVWAIIVVIVVARYRTLRRRAHAPTRSHVTTRQHVWFWLGLFAFWLASDWPVGTLGAGYLASIHMTQYMLYTFAAAPLLLLAAPEWWTRRVLARTHGYQLAGRLARPLTAVIITNAILIATHAPLTVDNLRATQLGSFALDVVWLAGGLIMWYPVIAPLPEHRVPSPPLRCVYLFGAAGVSSLIPAGFLTFANAPLYRSYEIAPRVGLDPLDDQQLAGAIMKVGALPVIWITMGVIWIRWATADRNSAPPAAVRGTGG